ELCNQMIHKQPQRAISLTTAAKRTHPENLHMMAEADQSSRVGGNGVIRKVSPHHLCEPLSLLWDRFMSPPPQLFLEGFQLRAHPIAARLPFELEAAGAAAAADMGKAQEVERLRF